MMKNVLIVEDESVVAMEIASYVKQLELHVIAKVSNAQDALKVVNTQNVDLVLMDIYLKGQEDGISCVEEMKKIKSVQVIYISAFSDEATLQRAIDTKPSSYLVKPFSLLDLKIAINIAIKNATSNSDKNDFLIGDIVFDKEFSYDTRTDELLCLGEKIHLTTQERSLLRLLMKSKNCVVSIYQLENELWPQKESNENTRRALVARLRSKLNYKFIETVHSIGYKICF